MIVGEDLYKQKNLENVLQSNKKKLAELEDLDLMSFGEYPSTTDRIDRIGPKGMEHESNYLIDDINQGHQNIYDPTFSLEQSKLSSSKIKSKDLFLKQRSSNSSNEVRKTSLSFSKEAVIEGYQLNREIGRNSLIFRTRNLRSSLQVHSHSLWETICNQDVRKRVSPESHQASQC